MQPLQMIYTSEIFPYTYRAKGIALEELFNQFGAAFNQFVNPIGLKALGWKYYIVYCIWVPIEWLVMFFFYPETKGPTLEEIADGKPRQYFKSMFDAATVTDSCSSVFDGVSEKTHGKDIDLVERSQEIDAGKHTGKRSESQVENIDT